MMKIRSDFVTNSSSSSFVINVSDITEEQKNLLLNPDKLLALIAQKYPTPCQGKHHNCLFFDDKCIKCKSYVCEARGWTIKQIDDKIVGYTIIDNFDMIGFLQSIGIPLTAYDNSEGGVAGLVWLADNYGIDVF